MENSEDGVVLKVVISAGSSMMSKKAAAKTFVAVIRTANHGGSREAEAAQIGSLVDI